MATEVAFARSFLSLFDTKPSKISPDHVEDPRNYPGSTPYTLPRHASCKPFSRPSTTTTTTTTSSDATTSTSAPSTTSAAAPTGRKDTVTVHLTSPRNPPLTLTLPSTPRTTSLGEIKEKVAAQTGLGVEKVKLLFGKRPVADSKSLGDLLSGTTTTAGGDGNGNGEGEGEEAVVELGVMVLGGAAALAAAAVTRAATAGAAASSDATAAGGAAEKKADEESTSSAPVAQGLSGKAVLGTGQFWEDLEGYLQQRVRDEGVASEALGVFRGAWEGRS